MHTTLSHPSTARRKRLNEPAPSATFRQPNYDCREQDDAMKLVVYVPGVEAAGVDIEAKGSDLIVTARKHRFVRVNWTSLHLEGAQRDYRLRLRLGSGIDYASMQAEIREGVLTILLPKMREAAGETPQSWRRVA